MNAKDPVIHVKSLVDYRNTEINQHALEDQTCFRITQ